MTVVLDDHAVEYSIFPIKCSFYDQTNVLTVPISASWTLTDLNGSIINNRNAIVFSPLASEMTIVLVDNDLVCNGKSRDCLIFVDSRINSTLGSNLRLTEEVRFTVDPIIAS